jgi:hypothetical protein
MDIDTIVILIVVGWVFLLPMLLILGDFIYRIFTGNYHNDYSSHSDDSLNYPPDFPPDAAC